MKELNFGIQQIINYFYTFWKPKCIYENGLKRINDDKIFVGGFIISITKKLIIKDIKGKYGRWNHSVSVFGIPYIILKELETNENDNSNIIGYIPFLGTLIDAFR